MESASVVHQEDLTLPGILRPRHMVHLSQWNLNCALSVDGLREWEFCNGNCYGVIVCRNPKGEWKQLEYTPNYRAPYTKL